MSTSNTVESPIVNSPIVNNPISCSPVSFDGATEIQDFNPCCAAGMPAGNRLFYFKFVFVVFAVLGSAMYGLYKLGENMGWFH